MARRILLLVAAGTFAVGVAILIAYAIPDDRDSEPTRQRLTQRLNRPSVRFHVALRQRLARGGRDFGRRVERAMEDAREAKRLANELLADKDPVDPTQAVLPSLGAEDLGTAHDRLLIMLAMVTHKVQPDHRLPDYVVLHEAERLPVDRVDPKLRGLAAVARAYAYSLGGYCDLIDPDPHRLDSLPSVGARDLARLTNVSIPKEQQANLGEVLSEAQHLLVDGARACCAMRQERPGEAAKHLGHSIRDLRKLDVAEHRLPILQAWHQLLRGNRDKARDALDRADLEKLNPSDKTRRNVVRDAIATPGPDGAREALLRSADREWLSQMILEGAFEAMARFEIAEELKNDPNVAAARTFVAAEHKLMEAARLLHPLFDHSEGR